MKIRRAHQADIPALVTLLSFLFEQEEEFQPDAVAQIRGLNLILAEPGCGCILLAEENGVPLAMVTLLFTLSTALGKKVALLEDMVVHPQARHNGIGTQLLKEAIVAAKKANCGRITLLTDANNFAAQDFYAKQDFVGSGMKPMRLLLD